MKFTRVVSFVFCLLAAFAFVPPKATADDWNKTTKVKFSGPVEVPGMVLPAGEYTFALMDSPSDRHIVQIWNADKTKLFVTILAINNYRLTPTGETVLTFDERPRDTPEALHAWFYPGDNFGQEFVYPKNRAFELAKANKTPVLAMPDEVAPAVLEGVPVIAVTAEQKEVPLAEVVQPAPQPEAVRPQPATEVAQAKPETHVAQLPQTASYLPLFLLLGMLCLAGAALLGVGSKAVLGYGLKTVPTK